MHKYSILVPRYQSVDVLNVDHDFPVKVSEYEKDALVGCLTRASMAYDQRFAADRYMSMKEYRYGRNSTNYPDGARGLALLGGFLFALGRDDFETVSILDWLCGPFTVYADGKPSISVKFEVPAMVNGKLRPVSIPHEEWVLHVRDAFNSLGSSIRNKSETGFELQVASTALLVSLFEGVDIQYDDGRFSTYVLQTVRNYITKYMKAFGLELRNFVEYLPKEKTLTVKNDEILNFITANVDVKYKYLDVNRYNMFDVSESFDRVLDFYLEIKRESLYAKYHGEILKVFKMIFETQDFKIFNGFIDCPQSFFAGLVTAATSENLKIFEENTRLERALTVIRENQSMLLTAAWLLPESGSEVLVPKFLSNWVDTAPDVATVTRDSFITSLQQVLDMDDAKRVLQDIEVVVKTYFRDINDSGEVNKNTFVMPPVSVCTAEINGINSLYHFSFDDSTISSYGLFKRSVLRGGTEDIKLISLIQTGGEVQRQYNDVFVRESRLLTTVSGRETVYGRSHYPERKLEALKRQFLKYHVRKVSHDRFELHRKAECKSIYSPRSAIRQFDVYLANMQHRTVDGALWMTQTFSLNDVQSPFDLWMTYDESIKDTDDLASLYAQRLEQMIKQTDILKIQDYKPCSFETVMELTPVNEEVLAIGGYGRSCDYVKTIQRPVCFNINPEKKLSVTAKTSLFKLQRWMDFAFPIHYKALNPRLYEDTAAGKVIYQSGDTTGDRSRLVIEKIPFSQNSFKDCVTCKVRVDLYENVTFSEQIKVNEYNTILRFSKKMIELDVRSKLPNADKINPVLCESGFLVDIEGKPVNEATLYSPSGVDMSAFDGVLTWCIRDNIAKACWGIIGEDDYLTNMTVIKEWLMKEFGLELNTKLTPLVRDYYDLELSHLDTMTSLDMFHKLFGFETRTEAIVPTLQQYDYGVVLNDSLNGIQKFVSPGNKIINVAASIPYSVVPSGTAGLDVIINLFANIAFEKLLV